MPITCCNGCVPPKRTPTCHFDGTCQEYLEQKATHDAQMAQIKQDNFMRYNLTGQRGDCVHRANRRNKKK